MFCYFQKHIFLLSINIIGILCIIRHSLTVSPSALLPIVGLGFGAVSTPGLCVRYVSGQNVSYPSILTIIKIICSNETILNKNVNECKKMLLELLNITR